MPSLYWTDNGCCTLCGRKGLVGERCPCREMQQQCQLVQQDYAMRHFGAQQYGFQQGFTDKETYLAALKERDEARAALKVSEEERERLRKELDEHAAEKIGESVDLSAEWASRYDEARQHANSLADVCGCLKADLAIANQRVGELTMQLERERKERRR